MPRSVKCDVYRVCVGRPRHAAISRQPLTLCGLEKGKLQLVRKIGKKMMAGWSEAVTCKRCKRSLALYPRLAV